jgi:hypothetical protein
LSTLIQLRRGTQAAWAAANSVLAQGEPGVELDTNRLKVGDGATHWNGLPYAPTTSRAILLCSGFTPSGTGADTAEVTVPFDVDGTSVVVWHVRRITFRVQTAGGAPSVAVEKSSGSGAFSASTVGTVTLGSGANEGSVSSALGTVSSGDKLRFNAVTLDSAQNWTVIVEISA